MHTVGFTPDGRRLISGGSDKTVRVRDVATGRETAMLTGHFGGVQALAVSSDGKRLATADGSMFKFWDATKSYEMEK